MKFIINKNESNTMKHQLEDYDLSVSDDTYGIFKYLLVKVDLWRKTAFFKAIFDPSILMAYPMLEEPFEDYLLNSGYVIKETEEEKVILSHQDVDNEMAEQIDVDASVLNGSYLQLGAIADNLGLEKPKEIELHTVYDNVTVNAEVIKKERVFRELGNEYEQLKYEQSFTKITLDDALDNIKEMMTEDIVTHEKKIFLFKANTLRALRAVFSELKNHDFYWQPIQALVSTEMGFSKYSLENVAVNKLVEEQETILIVPYTKTTFYDNGLHIPDYEKDEQIYLIE